MNIRPYNDKDKEAVRYICLNSDGESTLSAKEAHFILTTYCDSFIEKEPGNCFVAVDENDKAVGYIICAENYDEYDKYFNSEYINRFEKYDFLSRKAAKLSGELQQHFKEDYPAHFHIDILPEYQRMGIGHRLVDTLCNHLKQKGVKGVMLTAWENNSIGQSFYKKYGFLLLKKHRGNVAYGIKL